jgi:hypothetical protein
MSSDPPPFNEDDLYDRFPDSAAAGYGPAQGFNDWRHINDASLFTADALQDPVIQAFVNAPITVTYAQFKSSFRESEYFIHKPHRAMSGGVSGIDGGVEFVKGDDDDRTPIGTYVINHEQTLAWHITRSIVISTDTQAGQIIHKEPGS